MAEGKVYIYGGTGHGKSPAAIGCGLIAAAKGASVVIIQFLRGKGLTEDSYARRLEPEIKLFRFEKSDVEFESLPKEKQEDEVKNIITGDQRPADAQSWEPDTVYAQQTVTVEA